MRILHTSDLHLHRPIQIEALVRRLELHDYDVWCDTGDLLPDAPYWAPAEREYVQEWLIEHNFRQRMTKALAGRPALFAPGNHDAIKMAPIGDVPEGFVVNYNGFCSPGLAAYRRVNHWVTATNEPLLSALREDVALAKVLLTHAPPKGSETAQEGPEDWGCSVLTAVLRPGLTVLCGHVHGPDRRMEVYRGARIYNGACQYNVIEVDVG